MLLAKLYLKRLILLALLLLLLLPAGQAKFGWVNTGELTGYYEGPAPHPDLTWEALKTNAFQTGLEHYIEDRLGFRVWFIKLRNQFSYSILHETNDPNLFVGRNSALFDARTLYAYVGLDAVADQATVQRRVRHLRVVQDTLARRGKLLVFVAAASKASYMPENLPPYFRHVTRRRSNYDNYTAAMRAAKINLLDLSQALRSWKDTTSYPLFPQYGGHWSDYAATQAGDSLVRYVEQKYGHQRRGYQIRAGEISNAPHDNERDTEKPLNLLLPLPLETMKHPSVEYEPLKPGQRQPTVLIVGDSFVWTILYPFIIPSFDSVNSRFWFYNVINQVIAWPSNLPEGTDPKALDHKAQYLARDIIVVMFTESNLSYQMDYGFTDDAYKLFVPYGHADSLRIQAFADQIRQRPNLEDYWWKKGIETGLSTDQLIHAAAVARYDSVR
jgi:hypothetical protein